MKNKTILIILVVAMTIIVLIATDQRSQADGEYNYAFTGYTYVDGVKTAGVIVKLSIEGQVYWATSIAWPDTGRYNIGHYMDTGEFCLTGTFGEESNEKRDAYQGDKEEWGTIQQDLYLTSTGPSCIGQ
ncbi:MAG: hypothetical protein GF307_08065 [candidate division Zixibacteria bacterium]|nr:hypothetical protein [candidate division Zixibacteria bacterium]